MHAIYLLLRNNQQKGPYKLEELLQQSLKPNDLVWIEGQSIGWSYPTEISELAPYLSQKELYKKETELPVKEPAPHPVLSVPSGNAAPVYALSEAPFGTTGADTENSITHEDLERKANEIYERVQAYTRQKKEQKDNMETPPYKRTLEDIRQEYEDQLEKKKKAERAALIKKSLTVGAVLITVAATGTFIAWQWTRSNRTVLPLQEYVYTNTFPDTIKAKPAVLVADHYEEAIPVTEKKVTESMPATTRRELTVDEFIDSVEQALARSERFYKSAPIYVTTPKKRKQQVKKEEQPATVVMTAPAPPSAAVRQPELKKVPLNTLVALHTVYLSAGSKNTAPGLKLTVQNGSEETLKTVGVAIYYYKKKERLLNKEMVYINNIAPHGSLSLSLPVVKKATSAKARIEIITPVENN